MGELITLKIEPVADQQLEKIKKFADDVVKLNADKLGNILEFDLREGETAEYLIDKYTDAVLSQRAKYMRPEAIAAEIRDGYFIAMRDCIIKAFKNDPVITFYLYGEGREAK